MSLVVRYRLGLDRKRISNIEQGMSNEEVYKIFPPFSRRNDKKGKFYILII